LAILDEFNSYPVINKLGTFLERGRKKNLWFFILVQSLEKMMNKYKNKTISLNNF